MNHDEVIDMIPRLAAGDLKAPEREAMLGHLESCADCCDAYDVAVLLVAADRRARQEEHPASREIVAFAIGDATGSGLETPEIAGHIGSCAECSELAEAVRAAERSARRTANAPLARIVAWLTAPPVNSRLVAMTTAALAVALIGSVLVGVKTLRTTDSGRAWPESVPFIELEAPLRGSAPGAPELFLEGPVVGLNVCPLLPVGADDDENVRFSVISQEGLISWSHAMKVREVRARLQASHAILLLVPSADLAPGRFSLHVAVESSGDLLVAPFRIVGSRERGVIEGKAGDE